MTHEPGCHEEHAEMLEKITRIDQSLETHVSEVHGQLASVSYGQASDLEAMARIVVGPRKSEFLGGGRDENLGLGCIVKANSLALQSNKLVIDRLEEQAANGGFGARLTKAQATALYAAAIAGVSSIITALVN